MKINANLINISPVTFFFTCAFCLFVLYQKGYSQIGITTGYKTFYAKGWNDLYNEYSTQKAYSLYGFQVGIDYKIIRAKRYRLEYSPIIIYSYLDQNANYPVFNRNSRNNTKLVKLSHHQYIFQFNIFSYVFDFKSDITDPAHFERVGLLRRGFFMEIAPVFIHYRNFRHFQNSNYYNEKTEGVSTTIGGSIGVGIDLPLSERLTIIPLFRYYYFPDYDRYETSAKSDLKQIFVGCRLKYNFREQSW